MLITRWLRYWLLVITLAALQASAGSPRITFSCWIAPHSPYFMELERIYRDAFAAIGYDFVMLHRPALRSIQDANFGISDGECARDTHYLSTAPESPLLRVDVVVATADLQVWSNNPAISVSNLTELNNGQYRIGYLRGSSVTKSVLTDERLKEAHGAVNSEVAFKMLSADRIELLIISEESVRRGMPGLTLPKPVYHAGTLFRQSAYPYLHPRHRKLLPAFTAQLRQRIPEGGISLD